MSLVPKENLPVAALGSNSKIFHGFHAWTLFRVLDWLTDWLPEFAFHQHFISKSQSWQCWCMSETSEFLKVKLENIGHLQSCNVLDTPDIMFVLVPQDFMMCAHEFGGTSSAGCSNYALGRSTDVLG